MSPLNNSRLFHLLAESSQQHASPAVYEQAYNEFVEHSTFTCKQELNPRRRGFHLSKRYKYFLLMEKLLGA